jgi:hypothetical protein
VAGITTACEDCTEARVPQCVPWERKLPNLTREARAHFDELIERRRRVGMKLTKEIYHEAIDVAEREYPAKRAA